MHYAPLPPPPPPMASSAVQAPCQLERQAGRAQVGKVLVHLKNNSLSAKLALGVFPAPCQQRALQLLVSWLLNAILSQRHICPDNCTLYVATQWQKLQIKLAISQSTNSKVTGMTWPGKRLTETAGFEPHSATLEADTLALGYRGRCTQQCTHQQCRYQTDFSRAHVQKLIHIPHTQKAQLSIILVCMQCLGFKRTTFEVSRDWDNFPVYCFLH